MLSEEVINSHGLVAFGFPFYSNSYSTDSTLMLNLYKWFEGPPKQRGFAPLWWLKNNGIQMCRDQNHTDKWSEKKIQECNELYSRTFGILAGWNGPQKHLCKNVTLEEVVTSDSESWEDSLPKVKESPHSRIFFSASKKPNGCGTGKKLKFTEPLNSIDAKNVPCNMAKEKTIKMTSSSMRPKTYFNRSKQSWQRFFCRNWMTSHQKKLIGFRFVGIQFELFFWIDRNAPGQMILTKRPKTEQTK